MFSGILNKLSKDKSYETEFKAAVRLSKKWGLDTPEVKLSKSPLLSGEKGALALNVIQSLAMQYTAENISQQCFGYMYFVKERLESTLHSCK